MSAVVALPVCCLLGALLGSVGCDAKPPSPQAPADAPHPGAASVDLPSPPRPEGDTPAPNPAADPPKAPSAAPAPAPAAKPETPIETRLAQRAAMVYEAPDFTAAFRGKITRGEAFAVYEHVPDTAASDKDCDDGWARVGHTAFVCLDRSELAPADVVPTALPRIGTNGLTPYVYLKRKNAETPAPVWRSRSALRRGDDPVGALDMDHDYAFVRRRSGRGGRVFVDDSRRTVREADVRRLRPSAFSGRDLLQEPLEGEGTLAWVVGWPNVPLFEAASAKPEPSASLPFQTTVMVDATPTRSRGVNYYAVLGGPDEAPRGYVEAKAIRRYLPAAAPDEVTPSQRWIDVELNQQTLAVMRGDTAEFVTLISSGTGKHPTPPGLYRIENKQAFGDMRSRAIDSDDPYHVEAVPWVMYFDGRFALHGAFWHNRFGNRVSHGCVNLAPKDAARVFGELSPALPEGWHSVYEHTEDLGTLLRVRKGDTVSPKDRRRKPRRRTAKG